MFGQGFGNGNVMNVQSLQLVYFSPTGTTRRILEGIARGMDHVPARRLDITLPEGRKRPFEAGADQLLVVGVPVYFGRVPPCAMEWLQGLQARGTPVVCVVVYGNREYDDALLELKETLVHGGCIPVGCAAYIGEHSFSTSEAPIAAGRPDSTDLLHARSFGEQIMRKVLSASSLSQLGEVSVPGRHPYLDMRDSRKNLSGVDLVLVGSECAQCGECARYCPGGAIAPDCSSAVDTSKCILCHACIRRCPANARHRKSEMIESIALRLSDTLQERRNPVHFL